MTRTLLWSALVALVCVPAACGGRGQLEAFPGESKTGSTVGAGGSSSSTGPSSSSSSSADASSSTNAVSSTSVSGVSVSSGGTDCETANNCQDCADCAINDPCLASVNDCFSNDDCIAFNDCLQSCPGDCSEQCMQMHPAGAQLYIAAVQCVYCDACPNVCGDQIPPEFCGQF